MSSGPNRVSSDRSSRRRKAVLRQIAQENPTVYKELFDEQMIKAGERYLARSRAFTQLRSRFPERYDELWLAHAATANQD